MATTGRLSSLTSARIRSRSVIAQVIIMCGTSVLAVQQPTFRAGVNTVSVYATVSDRDGRLIPNLQRTDFRVFEDGLERDVSVFENTSQPIAVALMRDVSYSMKRSADLATVAMRRFILSLLPGDRACLGFFGGTVIMNRRLTSNFDELLYAVQLRPPDLMEATALWDAVAAGSHTLQSEAGQKVIVAVTDGADNRSHLALADLEEALRRDEVAFYLIAITPGHGAFQVADARRTAAVASDTGGGFYYLAPTDDVTAAFLRISDELHHKYLIGFSANRLDGKKHAIEVRVARPGMKARSRTSYVALRK